VIQLSPKAIATFTRWAKVTILSALALIAGAAVQLVTSNGLELGPTPQSLAMAIIVPLLTAFEKWANWQTTQ
jgi:hypothetical protein